MRPIAGLWTILSLFVGTLSIFAFTQPNWLKQSEEKYPQNFGLLSYCQGPEQDSCFVYPHMWTFYGSAHTAMWSCCVAVYGFGAGLQFICGLLTVLLFCQSVKGGMLLNKCVQMGQILAVSLLCTGLLLIPLGLSSGLTDCRLVESSSFYSLGSCHLDWAYVLAIMSCLLAIFPPILSNYTTLGLDRRSTTTVENRNEDEHLSLISVENNEQSNPKEYFI